MHSARVSSDAELRLAGRGLMLEPLDVEEQNPGCIGLLVVTVQGIGIYVQPGLPSDVRAMFAAWTEERLLRFAEHGPDLDPWGERSDGGMQLWARPVEMPSLDDSHPAD